MNMPKIISEQIVNYKLAPRKATDLPGSSRIYYVSTTTISGEHFQKVKELYIPPYAWETFFARKMVHYIQVPGDPPIQLRIGLGGKLLQGADLPPLTRYGRFRLRLYWLLQTLMGNV